VKSPGLASPTRGTHIVGCSTCDRPRRVQLASIFLKVAFFWHRSQPNGKFALRTVAGALAMSGDRDGALCGAKGQHLGDTLVFQDRVQPARPDLERGAFLIVVAVAVVHAGRARAAAGSPPLRMAARAVSAASRALAKLSVGYSPSRRRRCVPR
jgi:hypothetical protein